MDWLSWNLGLNHLRSFLDEGLDAFACPSGNFHNRAANGFSKDFRIEDISVSPRDVHHIDGHEDGNPQFHELCRQVEVAFKVAAINDIQDGIRPFLYEVGAGNDFFQGVRGKGIDPRQVLDEDLGMTNQGPFLFFNRNARPVANELIGSSEGIEQGRFARIRFPARAILYCIIKPSFQKVAID